ncbi:hypothetical protein RISK_005124 [Rhodopirellula islandica]|uniref:Uncharacterized protein n=1 Tax=Rhodopirellula islandica TaxID=595434 RepID=A0A0J1B8D5_RHOIS|nr:hypothetical protein RISK_005124 [Rhodopirellula islandica]
MNQSRSDEIRQPWVSTQGPRHPNTPAKSRSDDSREHVPNNCRRSAACPLRVTPL